MNLNDTRSHAEQAIGAVLPQHRHDLARLRVMAERGLQPVFTVVGKYNHGKSRLLNALIGSPTFAVADRRETLTLSGHVHDQVRWLDAPGLNADVDQADDNHAHRATLLLSRR